MSDETERGFFNRLIAEARRRNVIRVSGLYAAGAFVILQLADILMPAFGLSDADISYLLVAIAIGFPIMLVLTWVIDLTPEGPHITTGLTKEETARLSPTRLVDVAIVIIAIGDGYMCLQWFVADDNPVLEKVTTEVAAQEQVSVADSPSIAVLPFDNLSSSSENEWFAASIHEDPESPIADPGPYRYVTNKHIKLRG
tara:strand:- start:9997 stop:10590 length:594 start_codon:yes stop_codon:yes gene_type:complete